MAVTKPIASGTIVLGTPPEPVDDTAKVATMEAVQDLVTARISSAFIYQGSTDCSTNPNYPAASAGYLYRVSVAGKIGGASGVPAGAGDFFVALEDNAGGTEAAVGTFWEVWEGNLQPGVDYNSYRAEVDKINTLGDSVASDSASDIATASGDFITVSGNDPISSLGTADAGVERVLVFASTPTLTHNATSLILPTGANITCAAGDVAVMRSLGLGNWRCIDFVRASGEALTVSATSVGAAVHGATGKTTPVDADTVPLIDSAAGNVLKKLTWANIKATLKTYFDTLYAAVSHTHALSALTQSGATTGQVPEWSGSAWVPATPSGGGGSIAVPLHAWVESTGNDGTGAVGNPGAPYLTMAAAYAAGARVLHLGAGTFAGISISGAITLSVIGHGRGLTVVTEVKSTNGDAVTIHDLGCHSVTFTTISTQGVTGTPPGGTGTNAGNMSLRNVYAGTLNLTGGDGGYGEEFSTGGGSGGSGGVLSLYGHIVVTGSIYGVGGAGGVPYDDTYSMYDGGGVGATGSITGYHGAKLFANHIALYGGAGAAGVNGGNPGTGTSAGSITIDELVCAQLQLNASEDPSSPGTLIARRAHIAELYIGGSMFNSGTITGSFIHVPTISDMGSPSMSDLIMSHINGVPIGTV